MLLNNFSKMLNAIATVGFDGTSVSKNTTWDQTRVYAYYNTATRGTYMDIGFSNTAAQKTDYKLVDSNIVDENNALTMVSGIIILSEPYMRAITSVFRNNTSDTYTVREIGMVVKDNAANMNSKNVLIARSVLSEPVVMEPGDTYTFTYTIEI